MCGIVGFIDHQDVLPELLNSLANVEYRGYDSAGVSLLTPDGIKTVKRQGRLSGLRAQLNLSVISGCAGIGHTRWATHGKPDSINAHPHYNESVAVVHNGIIENHGELHDWLETQGYTFTSQTDSEVIPHLIDHFLKRGFDPSMALNRALDHLEGAFAIGVLFRSDPEHVYAARRGSPLVLGISSAGTALASDALALDVSYEKLIYLEEGDQAKLSPDYIEIRDVTGRIVTRSLVDNLHSAEAHTKLDHAFFMHKEMCEQPDAVSRTLYHTLHMVQDLPDELFNQDRLTLIGCGSSCYAAMVAKYWFESLAGLPVDVEVASEFRYRAPLLKKDGATIVLSQSGETADTLAALRYAKEQKQTILSIVNVTGSSIARESDYSIQTQAGPEISVASTKSFTSQLAVLACLAIRASLKRKLISTSEATEFHLAFSDIPALMLHVIENESVFQRLGESLKDASHVLFMGRGCNFPVALEGALKLKEISYIHAEGLAAGELKHGPIALVEEGLPVFILAPSHALLSKTLSNMEEVMARGARCIMLGDQQSMDKIDDDTIETILLPDSTHLTAPILYAIVLQFIAYHAALAKGTDVDQPRNLAKSVTVE